MNTFLSDPLVIAAIATVVLAAIAATTAVLITRTALAGTQDNSRAGIIAAIADLVHAIRGTHRSGRTPA